MSRTLTVSLVALVLTAVVLAACMPAQGSIGPATSAAPTQAALTQASQIVGVWQVVSPHCAPGFMIIRPDGTYTWSCNRDGSAGLSGKYRFADGAFMLRNDICGAEGQYQVHAADEATGGKALIFKVIKDECATDVNALTTQPVIWDSALP